LQSKIFYYCLSHNRPTGGQKHHYRHIDILNEHGYKAYIFHKTEDFRLTWFENRTPVVGPTEFGDIFDVDRDFLVVPEDMGPQIAAMPGRKVLFDKNVYYGFSSFGRTRPPHYPCELSDVVATLTVSEHNRKILCFAFPKAEIILVRQGVDTEKFRYRDLAVKKAQIAVATKVPHSCNTLFHLLQSRARQGLNRLGDYKWVFLEGMNEEQLVQALQESLILVFLSFEEGLPRTALEAMACGCLVMAMEGGPIDECVLPVTRFLPGDIVGIAKMIEQVADSYPDQLAQWEELSRAGRARAEEYSHAHQVSSVLSAWERILARA
jgi:glycosyltransferase involved in cell wall biosynthesis